MAKVLVVDDLPDNVTLLASDIADAGYEVLTATSGRQALEIIHEHGPEIIVTDWMMPEMSGLELCQAIRASEGIGVAYIIVLTAHSDEEQLIKAFEAGADDFLSKPYREPELAARVNAAVRIATLEANLAKERRAVFKANAELAVLNDRLHALATTDELTGLHNRREAMSALEEHWANATRNKTPLSCIIFDIDHFKRFNDNYGHDVGDIVLRKTAATLTKARRKGERVYRIGGEEFLLILPHADLKQATQGAERLRIAVAENVITHKDLQLPVTISLGVAQRGAETTSPADLLKNADEALYQAKQSGRDRVCAHTLTDAAPGATAKVELPAAGPI